MSHCHNSTLLHTSLRKNSFDPCRQLTSDESPLSTIKNDQSSIESVTFNFKRMSNFWESLTFNWGCVMTSHHRHPSPGIKTVVSLIRFQNALHHLLDFLPNNFHVRPFMAIFGKLFTFSSSVQHSHFSWFHLYSNDTEMILSQLLLLNSQIPIPAPMIREMILVKTRV